MDMTKPMQHEPKRNDRFLVEFPKQFNIQPWCIQKINKPKFTDGKWEDIRIDFIDPIGPSTSRCLFKIVNFIESNSCDNRKLFEVRIKSLDPTGVGVEEWVVNVEKVLTINFGELDYGDCESQKPFLILKPLNCVLNY